VSCTDVWLMVFNATFDNISVISWRWVLLVEETGVPGENHRIVASHWQTLYTSPWPRFELTTSTVISTDCISSCKSNYHTITTTTASVMYRRLLYFWFIPNKGSSSSWSYGSWIYNYMCNQCVSPLTLCIRIPQMARFTGYNIMKQW